MGERDGDPLVGKALDAVKGVVSATDGLSALNQIVEATREFLHESQEHKSARQRVRTYGALEVQRIKSAEATLRSYFDQAFAERRGVYEGLFVGLNQALESGNNDAVHAMVVGIVDLAKTSPLADLGDLSQVRAALDDPDQVWEL